MRVIAVALGVLLPVWSRPAAAQDAPARVDTVQLRFAWPVGTVASVETTRFREQVTTQTDTIAGSARYRMRVEQHPEGLLIVHDSVGVGPPTARAGGSLTAAAVTEQLRDVAPSYVVSSGGEFLRIDNVAGYRARLDTLVGSVLQPGDDADAEAIVNAFLSEDVLTGLAAQEWNSLVGMWIDGELELGESYELEADDAPVPMVPGATVPMMYEFGVMRRVACVEGGADTDCVEVALASYPDPDSLAIVLRTFLQRVNGGVDTPEFAMESFDVLNEMQLIIEPATLLPHRARVVKTVEAVIVSAGVRTPLSQEDIRTYRFTYHR